MLLVRRSEDDPELPGAWGLPAASCRQDEAPQQAARRIGSQKLGADIELGCLIAEGEQKRPKYTLEMALYAATLKVDEPVLPLAGEEKLTLYSQWRWGEPDDLIESANRGSLCSRLLLGWQGD